MKIEQPPQLNQLIDPSIPLTWPVRFRLAKNVMPLLVLTLIFISEQAILTRWLKDIPIRSFLPELFAVITGLFLFLLLILEIAIRSSHSQKRTINLEDKFLAVAPSKLGRIRWNNVVGFQTEPIPAYPELIKLTVELRSTKNNTRKWAMVLDRVNQLPQLKNRLKDLQLSNICAIPLNEKREFTAKTEDVRNRGVLFVSAAMFFFFHGFPVFLVGVLPHTNSREAVSANVQKMGTFLVAHASSVVELRLQFILLGATLLGLGAFFYWKALKEFRKSNSTS